MTLLANTASNGDIAFGDTTDVDAGKILYSHSTDSIHLSVGTSATENANCAIFDNSFGGSLLIPNQATVNDESNNPVKGDLITNIAGKLHINVGASDGATGLYVDSRNATRKAISVSASQTTMNVFQIDSTTLTEGSAIAIHDNSESTGNRKLLNIDQDHEDAVGGIALNVKTDGMQIAKFQTTKTSAKGVNISSSSGLAHAATLLEVVHDGASTTDTVKITSKATDGTQKILDVANTTASLFTVTASNKVGINDSTPSYTLDVNGNGRFVNDVYFNDDIFVASSIIHQGDSDTDIIFDADKITIRTGGHNQIKMESNTTFDGVILYEDASEKLRTYNSGVDVTGNLLADRVYPCYGNKTTTYLDHPSGDYGTIQINGSGVNDWEGYSIDGRAVFMHNGASEMGLYDDVNNHWALKHTFNGATSLYYDSSAKISTTSTGASITGSLTVSGSSVCANGIECRLRVLDENGTALNTC